MDEYSLIIVLKQGTMRIDGMKLADCSPIIRGWCVARREIETKGPRFVEFKKLLNEGTFSFDDADTGFTLWAVAWEYVVGMYILKLSTSAGDKIAEAVEKQVDLMEKDYRDRKSGDDWKGENDE